MSQRVDRLAPMQTAGPPYEGNPAARFVGRLRDTRAGATAREFLVRYQTNELSGLAAELSYRVFLSLFPFLIFLAALSGLIASLAHVSDPGNRVVAIFGDALPADAASLLSRQAESVANGSHASVLSLAMVAAIWTSSAAAGTLIKAMNRVYDMPESRPSWKRVALAIGMTVSAGLALVVVTAGLFATQIYAGDIAHWAGVGRSYDFVVQLLRIPIVLAVVMFATALIYWIAPDNGRRFRFISPGVVFFGVAWTAFTIGFAFYVTNFSSYGATYGALAGVVVLLLWTYISSSLLLASAQLNAIFDEEVHGEALQARRDSQAKRQVAGARLP